MLLKSGRVIRQASCQLGHSPEQMVKHRTATVDFEAFASRFARETDRACGILGPAFLDGILEELFRERLAALQRELLSHSGPLGSFSSRINIAYSLSWIDSNTHADLHTIRDIRNDFAHSFDHELHFDDQSIADRCRNLRSSSAFLDGFADRAKHDRVLSQAGIDAVRNVFAAPRWRFQIAVETIAQLLRGLPPILCATYTGPDLVKEAHAMSANSRASVHGSFTVTSMASPPVGKSDEQVP
ncbi:MAG: MltR family transcriptional regulator [Planctomycetota bacterium]|nr:MltR family transcriptional regulator [Planctomycetota bacterium]